MPIRLDLHVHSRHSPDSRLPVRDLVELLASRGLSGLALTDHNSVAGHDELRRCAVDHPELILIPGVEVSTREGHLLGYGVAEAPPPGIALAEAARWIADRGGAAVPAHPSRWVHGIGLAAARRVDVPALETRNGHTGPWGNRRTGRVAAERGLGATGGSDVHDPTDLGRCFTEFPEGTADVASAVRALRAGTTRAGGRPMGTVERALLRVHQAGARLRRGGGAI